jgi:hypothetical protein
MAYQLLRAAHGGGGMVHNRIEKKGTLFIQIYSVLINLNIPWTKVMYFKTAYLLFHYFKYTTLFLDKVLDRLAISS